MTNYNDGKWHGWNGGECPVHPKSKVEVAVRDTDGHTRSNAGRADSFGWGHMEGHSNIIAFRVVKEHREPREWWLGLGVGGIWYSGASKPYATYSEVVKVREVLE